MATGDAGDGDSTVSEARQDEPPDFDDHVRGCCEAIEDAIAEYEEAWGSGSDVVDRSVYTCAVCHAVEAGVSREDFLALVGAMYDECLEMTEFEAVMSPNWGSA